MRALLIAAALVAAVGFAATAQAGGCNLAAAKPWKPSFGGRVWSSAAYVNGPNCAGAVGTIVLRAPDGKVIWADARPTAELMTFVEAKTPKKAKAALVDWLTQDDKFDSTDDLPEWKKGADAPTAGEFPFYPEAGVDAETYAKIRAEKQAMFCYVQGMESMACIAIAKDGTATKVGVQSFPG
jgi:hypothetical protein